MESLLRDPEELKKEMYARADRRAAFWSGFLTASALFLSILGIFFGSGE